MAIKSKITKQYNVLRSIFLNYKISKDSTLTRLDLIKYNMHRHNGPKQKICYAPFKNIFFNTQGTALVCCFNHKVILGQYPQNSIREIWLSNKREKLIEHINKNSLEYGCYKCLHEIRQGNYKNVTSFGHDIYIANKNYPISMEFELSNTCNLECVMCSGRVSSRIRKYREGKEALPMMYDAEFVKQLEEFIPHLKVTKFTGGEPFLIDLYYDIWDKIIELNPNILIQIASTNGTVLNDRIKNLISKGNFRVNASLDSLKKENYEAIRKNADFDVAISNIHWYRNNTKNFYVQTTPFVMNWEEIPEIVKFCNENNIYLYFSTMFHPKELSLWNLPAENLKEIISFYDRQVFKTNNSLSKKNVQLFLSLKNSVKYWYSEKLSNPNFEDEFSKHMAKQEQTQEIKTITIQEIEKAKNSVLANIPLQIIQKLNIEQTLSEVEVQNNIPAEVVFLELSNIAIDEILNELEQYSNSEIREKVFSLYDELVNKYEFKI